MQWYAAGYKETSHCQWKLVKTQEMALFRYSHDQGINYPVFVFVFPPTGNYWNAASFPNPSSYLHFSTFQGETSADISFYFKTLIPRGVFLENLGNTDFIKLELKCKYKLSVNSSVASLGTSGWFWPWLCGVIGSKHQWPPSLWQWCWKVDTWTGDRPKHPASDCSQGSRCIQTFRRNAIQGRSWESKLLP